MPQARARTRSETDSFGAIEVPADGSAPTWFMNMYKVYEALPDALRTRIDGLHVKHDPAHTLQGELRDGYAPGRFEDVDAAEGPVHPLVRTHLHNAASHRRVRW